MNYELLKKQIGVDPIQIAKMYKDGISIDKIRKNFKIGEKKVKTVLNFYNIPIINKTQVCHFNQHIFDVIDTEEKAYWLGFIFADGCIYSKSKIFELSLSLDDLDHLNKFNKFMEHDDPDHIIIDKKINRCRWTVGSKHLWQTLNTLGCVPNKSLILKFPDTSIFKSKDLIKHFIRGYVDGDGSISYRNKNHSDINFNVLGTFEFLSEMQNHLPIKQIYKMWQKSHVNTWSFKLNGGIGLLVVDYLYNNSNIYLQRKYEKYYEFLCLPRLKNLMEKLRNIGEGCDANTEIND